jgi:hypothetical protein
VMLVAKYVKAFDRTGTHLSFSLPMWGTDLELQFKESACNLQPTGVAAASEQCYLTDSKVLNNLG